MSTDGMSYAPTGKPSQTVKPGEFVFAAAHLDHGHIYGQCNGLIEAGAMLRYVYDADPKKRRLFEKHIRAFVRWRHWVSFWTTPRCALWRRPRSLLIAVLWAVAGKDYFTDKRPFTTLDPLAEARRIVAQTGRKYMVYFSERLHVECAVFAGQLIQEGAIGQVVQVTGFGPHRLNAPSRPDWFFKKAESGGILCDIGSHQFEQFLHYSGATDARVLSAMVANKDNPAHPELEDFGEAHLLGNNGATNYIRVDWLTRALPDGAGGRDQNLRCGVRRGSGLRVPV